jgi:hypothetical protein
VQAPHDPPRAHLAAGEVVRLLQDTPAVEFDYGLELIDESGRVLEDISDDLEVGGSIAHANYADLHCTARLRLARELDWGQARVRPYMLVSDGTVEARFNLGAYFAHVSTRASDDEDDDSPTVFDVDGYDVLDALYDPVDDAVGFEAGTGYLDAAESILAGRGVVAYRLDPVGRGAVMPTDKAWAPDDTLLWLHIVNDLLGAVNYAGLHQDPDGVLVGELYRPPRDRAPEWTYASNDPTRSMLGPQRSVSTDIYRAPNRWVFYRTNLDEGVVPAEGAGKLTVINESDGPTSVDARGGRVITKRVGVDVPDQGALIARAQITVDADLRYRVAYAATTFPNPLHWHFDRLWVDDRRLLAPSNMLSGSWTLPLDGSDMTHEWTVLT